MKIAAIYDIHGNLPALEAVLHDIDNEEVDTLVVGGDVVAGPLPNETLERLSTTKLPTHFILGNAESDVLRYLKGQEIGGLSERANEEARWVAKQLTPKHINFLSGWSPTFGLKMDKWGDVLFCHGTPRNDMEIFTQNTSEEKLMSVFESVTASLIVCGHTHIQFDRTVGRIRVVNAGSVGMAFGATGANWLLLDDNINMKHTEYNLVMAAERIMDSNYPHAAEFAESNVLHVPGEEKMLNILSKLEENQARKLA